MQCGADLVCRVPLGVRVPVAGRRPGGRPGGLLVDKTRCALEKAGRTNSRARHARAEQKDETLENQTSRHVQVVQAKFGQHVTN
jgi:hypothetical protein